MPVSEFRSIELIDIGSLGKETISNDAFNNLARGVSGYREIPLGGLEDLPLASDTDDLSLYATLRFTGALAADCTVIAPSRARVYILDNRTTGGFDVLFKTSTGAGLVLPPDSRTLCYSDSINVYPVSGGSAGGSLVVASANGPWQWTTATSGAPSSAHAGINAATFTAATELRVHVLDDAGVDRGALLRSLQPQDEVYVQDRASSAQFVRYRLLSAGVNNGTWLAYTVVYVSSGGAVFTNNQTLNLVFSLSAALPAASTTQPGIVALADDPTTIAGVDATRAVTPAGLQAKWATLPPLPVQATTSVAGIAALATTAEGATGTNTTKIVTPAVLQAKFNSIPLASETVAGLSERATTAEILAGTDTTRFVTPAGLSSRSASETVTGLIELATTAEVTTGTDTVRAVTPATLAARIAAIPAVPAASETVAGVVELATTTETTTGTDTTRAVTPAGLAAKVPSGTALSVARYASSGTTLETGSASVVIDASGRLGVGQATPLAPLHMTGELRIEAGFVRASREASNASVLLTAYGDSPTAVYSGTMYSRARGTSTAATAVQDGDRLGLLTFQGYGTSMGASALYDVVAEETFSASARGSRIMLSTTALGTTTMTERLRVNSQGQIGVHTTLSATLGSGASYQALNVKGSLLAVLQSSVQERAAFGLTASWSTATDATRQGRMVLSVYDAVAGREILRGDADGTNPRIGFLGANAVARQTVPAAATDAATTQTLVNSLRTALVNLGLCV